MNGIEVGKECICIKSHSEGVVKKGEIYKVLEIKEMCCHTNIDVGIKWNGDSIFLQCVECDGLFFNQGIYWINIELFAPLADISELEKLLKEQPTEIQQ